MSPMASERHCSLGRCTTVISAHQLAHRFARSRAAVHGLPYLPFWLDIARQYPPAEGGR